MVNKKAWIETQKGRFNCKINFITAYAYLDEWEISCANQSIIYYTLEQQGELFLVDANRSHYKMENDLIIDNQICTEDLVIYQRGFKAFQKSFQFQVNMEISIKRRKVPRPLSTEEP